MSLLEQNPNIDISVLLPVRERPGPLEDCLRTLIDTASAPERIEVLIAFDDDDTDTIEYFVDVIAPYLDSKKVTYTAMQFKRLGYIRLNEYLNKLAEHSQGAWIFFWNDDAVMTTAGWDDVIRSHNDQFALLRAETNHEHPYAIFPILPRKWIEITGHLSPHQINDAWTSQIGWMLDIVVTIPVMIEHQRYDLTGKNGDDVFKNRPMLEGNPNNPRDFNHVTWRKRRMQEAMMIGNYLAPLGYDLTHFKLGLENKVDIWEKMAALDKKGLLKQWKIEELDH
jgi:glycosyltransferase involved in cell wall biosynthesis